MVLFGQGDQALGGFFVHLNGSIGVTSSLRKLPIQDQSTGIVSLVTQNLQAALGEESISPTDDSWIGNVLAQQRGDGLDGGLGMAGVIAIINKATTKPCVVWGAVVPEEKGRVVNVIKCHAGAWYQSGSSAIDKGGQVKGGQGCGG